MKWKDESLINETYLKEIFMNTEQLLSERLIAFMREMNEWEVTAYQESEENDELFDDEQWCDKQTAIRTQIYQEYFVQKEREYQIIEFDGLSDEPYYDPELENITKIVIQGDKASIFTDKHFADEDYEREYQFKFIHGKWLIDNIKERYELNKDWDEVMIL